MEYRQSVGIEYVRERGRVMSLQELMSSCMGKGGAKGRGSWDCNEEEDEMKWGISPQRRREKKSEELI